MSKKDWTNKLQEQLADYQVPAKDDLWASISQSLAQQDSPANGSSEPAKAARIVMYKRWTAAAAVALALAGGVAVYWHRMESKEDAPLAQISSEPKSPMKTLTAIQHAATTVNGAAFTGNVSSSGNVSSAAQKGSVGGHVLPANNVASLRIHGNRKATMNEAELGLQQDAVVCTLAEDRGLAAQEGSDKSQNVLVSSLSQDGLVSSPSQDDLASVSSSPSARSMQEMVASRNDHMAQDDALFGVDYANPPHSAVGEGMLHPASVVEGDWTVNLFAENMVAEHGTGMSNNGYHVLASAPEGFFADQNGFYMAASLQSRSPLYAEAKHHAPLSVGALVGVSVAPGLSLNTGIVYTRVASDFKTIRMDEFNIHQVLHYVGVPLGLNYEFWSKGVFHTYVMAGAQADFNVKNDTEDNGVKVEAAKCDRVQFSGKASLGAQVDILPSVGIYVEPGVKYYFNNGSKIENTFKDKKWNFNFQFGLRVNL